MTVPPGPVIPEPLLPSRRTDARHQAQAGAVFPLPPRRTLGGGRPSGQRDKRAGSLVRRPEVPSPDGSHHLARRIYAAAHLTGTFTLRSGVVSHEYFDKYRFESDPQLLADIAEACAAFVPDRRSTPSPAWSSAESRSPR